MKLPLRPLELSEHEPDAQIKSASCPEQWLPEATADLFALPDVLPVPVNPGAPREDALGHLPFATGLSLSAL